MTLPNERRNSIIWTRDFLRSLLDPKETPGIPKKIRQRAHSLLRHYPSEYEMERAKKQAPRLFGEWDSEFKEDSND
jgi:hypothetical protein